MFIVFFIFKGEDNILSYGLMLIKYKCARYLEEKTLVYDVIPTAKLDMLKILNSFQFSFFFKGKDAINNGHILHHIEVTFKIPLYFQN